MADTWIVGGRGKMSGAANNNGGGFEQGGTATYLTCQDANGGPTSTVDSWEFSGNPGCNVTAAGSCVYVTGTQANTFDDCVADSFVYIEFTSALYVDDWYVITSFDVPNNRFGLGIYHQEDTTCKCHVGGAFTADNDGLDTAFALMEADDIVAISTDTTTSTVHDISASITMPATAGGALTPIKIKGVNKETGADLSLTDARPILRADAVLATGIIYINSSSADYYKWDNIIFDGDSLAAYCVRATTTSNWHIFNNCSFRNSTGIGVSATGAYWTLIDCDDQDCGSNGLTLSGAGFFAINHTSSGCGGHGMALNGLRSICVNCISYGATLNGLTIGAVSYGSCLAYCTSYNCGQWGMRFNSGAYFSVACNNSVIGGLYDYYFNSIGTTHVVYFGHNHANGTNHYELGANSTFPDLVNGNNITGDPKFISTTVGSEDFDLEYDSPLQRAGINNTTIGAGTRKEITEGCKDVAFNAIYIQEEDVS